MALSSLASRLPVSCSCRKGRYRLALVLCSLALTASAIASLHRPETATSAEISQSIPGRQLRQADLWSVPAQAAQEAGSQPCPTQYDRMTVEEVEAGAKPYVFGGDQQPACQACKSSNERAQYCRWAHMTFDTAHVTVVMFLWA